MTERARKSPAETVRKGFNKLTNWMLGQLGPDTIRRLPTYPEMLAGAGYDRNIGVLSLDDGSGTDFCNSLRYLFEFELKNKINTPRQLQVNNVPPRVFYRWGSSKGELSPNKEKVARPIAQAIFDAYISEDIQLFTIACNTASLAPFVTEILEQVRRISLTWRAAHLWDRNVEIRKRARGIPRAGLSHGNDYLLIDTLSSLRTQTPQRQLAPRDKREERAEPETRPQDRELLLGTEALANEVLNFYNFFTPLDERSKLPALTQPLIQEIIWRIKLWQKNDVSAVMDVQRADGTRGPLYKDFDQLFPHEMNSLIALLSKIKELLELLNKAGYQKLVLACTELPLAFKLANYYGLFPEGYDPMLIDMAVVTSARLAEALDPSQPNSLSTSGVPSSAFGTIQKGLHKSFDRTFFRHALGLPPDDQEIKSGAVSANSAVPESPQPTLLPNPTPAPAD